MDNYIVKLRDYLETSLRTESRHSSTNELINLVITIYFV